MPVRPREPVSFIDLALVDAAGNIDVIQIKKLFDDALMARTPCDDNYIPAKKLSGRSHTRSICRKWGLARERASPSATPQNFRLAWQSTAEGTDR